MQKGRLINSIYGLLSIRRNFPELYCSSINDGSLPGINEEGPEF